MKLGGVKQEYISESAIIIIIISKKHT